MRRGRAEWTVASVVRGGYHLNSDHSPIDGSLRLERRELWGMVDHDEFSQRGWVLKTDEAKQIYMREVANDLCWMNEEAIGKALVSVEEIIYSHAVGINSDNSATRQWSGLQEHRKRLAELRATLRQEAARDIRITLRRDIRRELNAKMRMVKGEQLNTLLALELELLSPRSHGSQGSQGITWIPFFLSEVGKLACLHKRTPKPCKLIVFSKKHKWI